MVNELTTVVKPTMYERLQHLADKADISIYRLAQEAGFAHNVLYQMKHLRHGKERQWNTDTANRISKVLADHMNAKPSEVYAYLTGLEEETKFASK